jgi:hypothetical protein
MPHGDRFYAAACQFDLPNPASRSEIPAHVVERIEGLVERKRT